MPAELSVMTWNVENLFRPASDEPDVRERYDAKLTLLSDVIRQHAPDVVALQEIGSVDALNDLCDAIGAPYAQIAASRFPDSRGIRVAFVSKLEIHRSLDIVDFAPGPASNISGLGADLAATPVVRMGRGALLVEVRKQSESVSVLTLHLKSKLLSYPPNGSTPRFEPKNETERTHAAGVALNRRTAEAVAVREQVNDLLAANHQELLIALGDFNDAPEAATTQIMQGPEGSEIGTRGFDLPDRHDAARLFNTSFLIPENRRYSRIHRGRGELLDQIFASAGLFPRDSAGRRRLPRVDSLVDFHDGLPSMTNDPTLRARDIAPDHAPVIARFEL